MRILALTRAPQFSPNSVEKDREIMMAVARLLQKQQGNEVVVATEQDIRSVDLGSVHISCTDSISYDFILSMGRREETIAWLKEQERRGIRVINSPEAVEICSCRARLTTLMQEYNIPMASSQTIILSNNGGSQQAANNITPPLWLKRGDACAQSAGDIVFCHNEQELKDGKKLFADRNIKEYIVSEHVEGDLVKFYGLRFSTFFRYYYPTDDNQTKFDDEKHNGTAHHYWFDEEALKYDVSRLATYTGTMVYGGDAIIRADGSYAIIDFNDWPSFSRCREEAAHAIAELISRQ